MNEEELAIWENAASPLLADPSPPHNRGGKIAPPTPAARVAELTQQLGILGRYLNSACVELRRFSEREKSDPWHRFGTLSFGGIAMAQYPVDLLLWEAVMNGMLDLVAIVELGTWKGGFSWWLWAQAEARGLMFRTYDVIPPDHKPPPGFVQLDIFAEAEAVGQHLSRYAGPVLLFCDGGNKPREIKTFPSYLPAGSLVMVHDWGTETLPEDVPDNLEMVFADYCESLGSITRCFKII